MSIALADRQYTLTDFRRISRANNYELTQDVIDTVNKLATRVGAPTYQKTPIFRKRDHNRTRRPQRTIITAKDWEEMRNFKTTTLKKNESGIEKDIDTLRMLLNKITESNYDEMRKNIIDLLTNVLDSEPLERELVKVGESIFNIGCMNKFWSKLYAQLYRDLLDIFPIMTSVCEKNFASFLSLFDNIRYVPAEENYDEFCAVNKENSKRRSISSFFVHLMKNNVISSGKLANIIVILIEKFNKFIDEPNKKNEIDEIGENLVILIGEGRKVLEDEYSQYSRINAFVVKVSEMRSRDHISLTSKTVFKFMDLDDE